MGLDSRVIFRLPNQGKLFALIEGSGNDGFVVQPFDKTIAPIHLTGRIQEISKLEASEILSQLDLHMYIEDTHDEVDYKEIVNKAVDAISNGDFKKVVLARKQMIHSSAPAIDVFFNLEANNPNAFVYTFCVDGKMMLGASPETLLNFKDGVLQTEALGGTKTHNAYSDKEFEEHQQIVKYITDLLDANGYQYELSEMQMKRASRVEHLQTPIRIQSKGFKDDLQLVNVLHPTSAVCGLPFQSAYDFIKNSEGFDRKFYAGYLGYYSENSAFEMYVNLRCANVFNGIYELYAGAGINSKSIAEDEFNETDNKFQTIEQWLK